MSKIEKAYAITDAKISFVSLVDKAANKKQFLITKAEHGSASFASYGRIVNADADSHYITGIVYEPLTEDAHGNYMTEQEITKAAYWFAKNGNQVDVQHSFEPLEKAAVVESYVAPCDMSVGEQAIKKGTWMMTVEVDDPDIFEKVQKGEITGFSMGGVGKYSDEDDPLPDDGVAKAEEQPEKGMRGMSVITFKPNDHTKITTDFERYEFACPCGCTAQMIDPELVQKMQTIRTKLGKAIKVTSGYRCVKHNADPKVGGSRTSRHLYGIAADWRTNDRSVNPVALGIIAAAQGFGAVGIYWHDKAAIVHTDTRGGKATWLCVQPGVYPSTTYNKFVLPTIEQGCEGAANRAATVMLQRLLGIPHDGSFGPATTKALMTAQRKHGLVPDGICGPKSWTALSGADKYL